MGLLFRIALRLAPLRKLKARRTQLLLEKSWLLSDARAALSQDVAGETGTRLLYAYESIPRLNDELDAINNEIGRRGER